MKFEKGKKYRATEKTPLYDKGSVVLCTGLAPGEDQPVEFDNQWWPCKENLKFELVEERIPPITPWTVDDIIKLREAGII